MTTETTQLKPQRETRQKLMGWIETGDVAPILDKARPFTMVTGVSLVDLVRQVQAVLTYDIPGDFVECGVWRGGTCFLMAEVLRQAGVRDRKVWLFDSFEGMPTPEEIDGPAATAWANNRESPEYFDNCRVSLDEVQRSATELGLASYTEFVKGWFDQTLPANRDRIGPIAILRVDCDWYSSVRCCLENLYDQVVEGGFVIFDDYYTFEGCAIALHEFLGKRGLAHRIESVVGRLKNFEYHACALFRKGKTTWRETWNWMIPVHLATEEIAALIPPGDALILVDQAEFGSEIAAGRRPIPFLERGGEYWGPPPDDATAIQEFERLRKSGASFIVFGWPAFWWFGYYPGFHHHLRSTFRCVMENERVVVFDLRR